MAGTLIRATALALGLVAASAQAVCISDNTGASFTNPNDAACRNELFTYTENDTSAGNLALGYAVPVPVASLTGVDGFRSYASLLARHQDLMTMNPMVNGAIVGQTRSGGDIWAYLLGDTDSLRPDGTREGAVMLNGGIHAREWQSPEAVSETLEQLAASANDGGIGQFLAENLTQVIIPVLNVDGFRSTQAWPDKVKGSGRQPRDGRMRRKNLAHPSRGTPVDMDLNTTDDSFHGVDLNRNSFFGFGLNGGSSNDAHSLIYHGAAPASEPEILALQAGAALAPAERLRLYTDVHSFSQIFFTPLTGNARRDTITIALMDRLRAVSNFRYRDGRSSAATTGNLGIGLTSDYFAYEYQIPSWTLETEPLSSGADYGGTGLSHSGFVMPDSEVRRMREEVASMLILGAYRQAGAPAIAAASIVAQLSGQVVYEARWNTNAAGTARNLEVVNNAPLTPGTQYLLWLAFDKPMRMRDASGTVSNYAGQNVPFPDIVLAAPELGSDGLQTTLAGDAGAWLAQPGGAPNGYLRYADDALSISFTLPANWPITGTTSLVLQVNAMDLSQQNLDANPATPVDWSDGHWLALDHHDGSQDDFGGIDCHLKPFAAPAGANAAPPGGAVICPAAKPAPPPAPPPVITPAPTSSGGGGASLWLGLVGSLVFILRRRRVTGFRARG